MPRACRICPRLGIRCPVGASRLRATRASPHRSSRQGARQRRKPQRKLRSDGDLRRYGGGGPLRPYTRSDGAPNCAPSLRSVAGLLCRSLAAAYEDPLRLPSRFVANSFIHVAPLVALLWTALAPFSRTHSLIHGTSRANDCARARVARTPESTRGSAPSFARQVREKMGTKRAHARRGAPLQLQIYAGR